MNQVHPHDTLNHEDYPFENLFKVGCRLYFLVHRILSYMSQLADEITHRAESPVWWY
jgi:hypothetical protein